jgi:antitoxin VapB
MQMSLYVRDESVNRLAEQVRKTIGARTKTDAVRVALEKLLQEHEAKPPFSERLKALQAKTRALGEPDPHFDEKAFTDEMWGNI